MCKVGDKFVIEIGGEYTENPFEDGENGKAPTILYKIKGFNSLVFDKNGLDNLEKYEGDAGYEKGLSDAWEYVKKIYDLSFSNTKEIYGEENDSLLKVMRNLTPQEAVNKLKAWEEKQEIKAGDVIVSPSGSEAIVHLIDSSGNLGCIDGKEQFFIENSRKKLWKKTGKHIDLTEIFKGLEVI